MLTAELATTAPAPPLAKGVMGPAADDPVARAILRRAQGMFQKWPEGFPGFRARVRCETADGSVEGRLAVAPGCIDVQCDHARICAWLSDTLRTIASHRTPRFFDEGDGRYPIDFAQHAPDEAGRAIDVHCPRGRLRYWINARGRISQVERVTHELRAITIFDELVRATPGRVLPARTTRSTWDAATGTLLRSEAVHDGYRRIDHVWLPASRQIRGPLATGERVVQLTLEDHQLL